MLNTVLRLQGRVSLFNSSFYISSFVIFLSCTSGQFQRRAVLKKTGVESNSSTLERGNIKKQTTGSFLLIVIGQGNLSVGSTHFPIRKLESVTMVSPAAWSLLYTDTSV